MSNGPPRPTNDNLFPYNARRTIVRVNGALVDHVLSDLETWNKSMLMSIASFLTKEDFNKFCCISKKLKDSINHTPGQQKLDIVPSRDNHGTRNRVVTSLQSLEGAKSIAVGEIVMHLDPEGYPLHSSVITNVLHIPVPDVISGPITEAFHAGMNASISFPNTDTLKIKQKMGFWYKTAPFCCIAQAIALCPNILLLTLTEVSGEQVDTIIELAVNNCPQLKKLELLKCGNAIFCGSGNALKNGTNLKEVYLEDLLIKMPLPPTNLKHAPKDPKFAESRLLRYLPANVQKVSLKGCGQYVVGKENKDGTKAKDKRYKYLSSDWILQFILLNPTLLGVRASMFDVDKYWLYKHLMLDHGTRCNTAFELYNYDQHPSIYDELTVSVSLPRSSILE